MGELVRIARPNRCHPGEGCVAATTTDVIPRAPGRLGAIMGAQVPVVDLVRFDGEHLSLPNGLPTVIHIYPGTDWSPDGGNHSAELDALQLLSFERENRTFHDRHLIRVMGLSSVDNDAQDRDVRRHRIAHPLYSDANLQLAVALGLPIFEYLGSRWYRRAVLFVEGNLIRHAIHPICSPQRAPAQILCWLKAIGHPLAEPIEAGAPPAGSPRTGGKTPEVTMPPHSAAYSQNAPVPHAHPRTDASGWPASQASDDDAA
jgi:peroxiredoxin